MAGDQRVDLLVYRVHAARLTLPAVTDVSSRPAPLRNRQE